MARSRSKRFMGIPDEFWIGFVLMVGFFLKLIYDTKLGWAAGTLGAGVWQDGTEPGGGHLGLIQYYFTHHWFPGYSSRELSCYSNPPLYYITSSLLLEIFNRIMGWSISISLHLVQAMNVLYVMVGECCGIGILLKFGVRGRKMIVSILFLIFFPAFYNLSAAMDGSALAFMYMMLALNSALSWFDSRRYQVLRSTAITIGLALMTSLTCVMILPPILYLLKKGASDGRRNETPVAEQAKLFGRIVVIMGAVWPVYQLLRFRVPFVYVEPLGLGEAVGSFGSRMTLLPRIGLLSHVHTVGAPTLESNVWAQTFKTAAVDFSAIVFSQRGTRVISMFLIYLLIALCVLMHVMFLYTLISLRLEHVYAMFLLIGELTIFAGYVIVCFAFPYIRMMDFKAIAPVLIFPLAGMALCGGESSDGPFELAAAKAAGVMILVMSVVTAFLYGFYAA